MAKFELREAVEVPDICLRNQRLCCPVRVPRSPVNRFRLLMMSKRISANSESSEASLKINVSDPARTLAMAQPAGSACSEIGMA